MTVILSYALTSVSDVKESMGIATSDLSWDNLITRKINQVTQQIEAYCGRRFKETVYTDEEYSSTQTGQLVLKQRPITTTTPFSFSARDTALNLSDWESITSDLYFVDTTSGVVNLLFRTTGSWNRWKFTYSAGFATIPQDLAEIAATLAAYYAVNAQGQVSVQEKREGSRVERFFDNPKSFTDLIGQLGFDEILDAYANYPINSDK